MVSASVHAKIHTPLGKHPPPRPVHAGIQCPVHAGIDMATAADGTHPTGMHSCSLCAFGSPPRQDILSWESTWISARSRST